MNFTEPIFGLFLVAVMVGLCVVRRKQVAIGLIIFASAVFYGWWNVTFLLLLASAALVDFFLAQWIAATKNLRGRLALLILSVCWNLGILLYFKYANFLVENLNSLLAVSGLHLPELDRQNITLPVGISFFTFETLSYSIDVYRGSFRPIRKLSHFFLFISFFPHLVAGPIVRGKDFLPQVEGDFLSKRDWSGLFYVWFGLGKKMLLADPLGRIAVDPVFANSAQYGTADLLFAIYCYSFQIFLDFSGYTDIAIGLARIMGFDLGVNFNAPYLARSFTEFWHRWHISLSTWFRDYVFIPLGGSRVRPVRLGLNVFVVFLVSGLWHGAYWRFVIWGAVHGILVVAEALCRRISGRSTAAADAPWSVAGVLRVAVVFNIVSLAWIFFRAEHWQQATQMIQRVFTAPTQTAVIANTGVIYLLITAMLLHVLIEPVKNRTAQVFQRGPALLHACVVLVIAALLFDQSLQRVGHRAFIYFQF